MNASEEEIQTLIKDVDVLMTDGTHFRPVDKKLIESGRNLKLILCPIVGYDEVDLVAARENGIPVVYSAGIASQPIAEYVIMAAIYLLKHIKLMDAEFQERRWSRSLLVGSRYGRELGSQTIGIIGCGNVGQQVARLAKTFGSKILYHNRRKLPEALVEELRLEYASLDEFLRRSDIVSVHVPLTEETRGMIGVEELTKMREGAVLINTVRGHIVDEQALADAIESGHLSGAAVDAFDNEPNIETCPLIGLENVLLTPHMCSRTLERDKRVQACVKENLVNLFEGKPLVRVIN